LRKIVAPGEPVITYSKSNAFRLMGDTKELQADSETKLLWESNQNTWKGWRLGEWSGFWSGMIRESKLTPLKTYWPRTTNAHRGTLQNFALGFSSGDGPLSQLGNRILCDVIYG
jgi:hypothetical protein